MCPSLSGVLPTGVEQRVGLRTSHRRGAQGQTLCPMFPSPCSAWGWLAAAGEGLLSLPPSPSDPYPTPHPAQ